MRRPLVAPGVVGVLALVLLAAPGCGRGDEQHPRAAAEARVGRRLYAENLLADPAVGARVRAAVQGIEREGVPADSALTALDAWLEDWAARNPERAARARMLSGRGPCSLVDGEWPPRPRPTLSGVELC